MRYSVTAVTEFDAGHRVPDHSWCSEPHGHYWTVQVTVDGGLDPRKIFVLDHGELADDVAKVSAEFVRRDLNMMIPAGVATPEGLAMYFHERLVLKYPRITAIEAGFGPVMARVEWDPR